MSARLLRMAFPLLLVACGQSGGDGANTPIVGTWGVTATEPYGVVETYWTFWADSNVTLYRQMSAVRACWRGTYTFDNATLTVTFDRPETYAVRFLEDKMRLEEDIDSGLTTMTIYTRSTVPTELALTCAK